MARLVADVQSAGRVRNLESVTSGRFTRRRALALGAAAGVGALLARTPTPAFADTRLFSMPVRLGETLRAPRRFDLVGIKGQALERARPQLRTRREGGSWSDWVTVHPGGDHGPDDGRATGASDPIWVDGALEVQVRAAEPLAPGARLQLVAVSPIARRAGARAARRARASTRQVGGVAIMPRSAWGARAPRAVPTYGEVQVAFVHHTVTANEYAPGDVPAILRSMQAYHMDSNGWADIGYNFLVDRFGVIWEGREGGIDQPVVGAQAQGWNSDSTGISNIGTFTSVAQSAAAVEANARLIAWKLSLHGAPTTGTVPLVSGGGSSNRYPAGRIVSFQRISGHRDADATTCPGDALYGQLAAIRARAAQLASQYPAPVARLELAASPPVLAYGDTVRLTGAARRPDGTPVPGIAVTIEKRGSTAWVPVGSAQSAADGSYSLGLAWRGTGRLRARAAVDGTVVVSTASTVLCVPRLSRVARRARAGSRARLRGKVRPAQRFELLVERRVGTRFRRVGTFSVRGHGGGFTARVPLRRAGRYRIAPVVQSGGRVHRGTTTLLRVIR